MMELALITPAGRDEPPRRPGYSGAGGKVSDLFVGILPFVAVIIAFPALVTWLPGLIFR